MLTLVSIKSRCLGKIGSCRPSTSCRQHPVNSGWALLLCRDDLTLVFDKLQATRTKLNPDKCVFGVSAGKLLGFLVSHRGIEENPEKIKAI
jgi:ribonuclease HI